VQVDEQHEVSFESRKWFTQPKLSHGGHNIGVVNLASNEILMLREKEVF